MDNSTESGVDNGLAAGITVILCEFLVTLSPATTRLLHDPKFIRHLENSRHAVSGDGRQVLVAFVIDDARERDALVPYDDVDTRGGLPEIARERAGPR